MTYKALLFSPDGECVTDYHGTDTIEAVEEHCADQGSRWYFYPFEFVVCDKGYSVTDSQRVVSAAYPFEDLKGKTIKTVRERIIGMGEENLIALLGG